MNAEPRCPACGRTDCDLYLRARAEHPSSRPPPPTPDENLAAFAAQVRLFAAVVLRAVASDMRALARRVEPHDAE